MNLADELRGRPKTDFSTLKSLRDYVKTYEQARDGLLPILADQKHEVLFFMRLAGRKSPETERCYLNGEGQLVYRYTSGNNFTTSSSPFDLYEAFKYFYGGNKLFIGEQTLKRSLRIAIEAIDESLWNFAH